MRRNALTRLVCVGLLAALLHVPAAATAAELKIATLVPKGSSWAKALDKAAALVGERTQGRVKLKFYFGGTQGDERDFVRKIKLGQIDGAAVTSVGLGLIHPDVKALDLPFLFRNQDEVDYVRARVFPVLEKKFDAAGFVVLAWAEAGWVRLYHAVPLTGRADLPNVKMWLWSDDPVARSLFQRMGVNGVPLGVPDVLPSLQTGLINGCYGSTTVAVAFQWYSKIKYASKEGFVLSTAALVLSKEAFAKLTPEDRKVLLDVGRALGAEMIKVGRRDDERARKAMERSGVKFVDYAPDIRADFEKHSRAAWNELAGKTYSREMLALVQKYLAEVRK